MRYMTPVLFIFPLLTMSTLSWPLHLQDIEVKETDTFLEDTSKMRDHLSLRPQNFGEKSHFKNPGQGYMYKMDQHSAMLRSTAKGQSALKGHDQSYSELQEVLLNDRVEGSVPTHMECTVCKLLVMFIQTLVSEETTQDTIAKVASEICLMLKIEDKRVCQLIIKEFKDEVLTVLDKLVLSPTEVCGLLLGNQCAHPYDPYYMWNITLPAKPKPPVKPPVPPKVGAPKVRVVQLSDIHIDLLYKSGSNAECGEPLCCRANDGPVKGTPAGHWGDYRQCDTPPWTLENLFEHLVKHEKFDYIYWTGDLPGHVVWNQTRKGQEELESYLTNLMLKYFPDKPIFPCLGNHESAPVNSFPPPMVKGSHSIDWLYKTLASNWSSWLPKDTLPDILRGAYYTVLVQPGFRIVSINTNYCNSENWWLLLNSTDPAGELQWLVNVLQAAEDNKEKVHILGHIPPGIDNCLKAWSWNYYKIINRYESTIVGQYFGHTHTDSFMVFYDDVQFKRPVSVGYVSPSVTPYAGNYGTNPSYRVYEIDGGYSNASWAILDHITYMFNLTEANKSPSKPPSWKLEYSAKAAYNMSQLNPEDWDDLVKRMASSKDLFNTYYMHYYHGHPPKGGCDRKCRLSMLCEARSGRSHDTDNLCKDFK